MAAKPTEDAQTTAQTLLEIIRELTREIHRQPHGQDDVRLDSTLDKELGLDSLARATGTPVPVHGLENLPPAATHCLFVANHVSYLDGHLLVGYLPRRFSFVAKAELLESAPVRIFLQRIETDFIERFNAEKGVI